MITSWNIFLYKLCPLPFAICRCHCCILCCTVLRHGWTCVDHNAEHCIDTHKVHRVYDILWQPASLYCSDHFSTNFCQLLLTWSPWPPSCNKLGDWLKFSQLIRVISVCSSPINWAKFLPSPTNRKRGPKKIIVRGPYTVTCMAMTSYSIHIPTDHSSATRHVGGGQCHTLTSMLRSYCHKTGSNGKTQAMMYYRNKLWKRRLQKQVSRMEKTKRRESR